MSSNFDIQPLATYFADHYDALTGQLVPLNTDTLFALTDNSPLAHLLIRSFQAREQLFSRPPASTPTMTESHKGDAHADEGEKPQSSLDVRSNRYIIDSFRAASSLGTDKGLPLGKLMKGTEIASTVDTILKRVGFKVQDLASLKAFSRQASTIFSEHGFHGIQKILLFESTDPSELNERYKSYYEAHEADKSSERRNFVAQEQELLHSFLKKAFRWNPLVWAKINELGQMEQESSVPEDVIGLASLLIVRQNFEDVTLDNIIRATFGILTYFASAGNHTRFDTWLHSYQAAKRDYKATYGDMNEQVLELANVFLALQIIGKKSPDLARTLRLQKLQWRCTTMSEILAKSDKIKDDLIQTARQWGLEFLSGTDSTVQQKSDQRDKGRRYQKTYAILSQRSPQW